jgi:hypothetical protein
MLSDREGPCVDASVSGEPSLIGRRRLLLGLLALGAAGWASQTELPTFPSLAKSLWIWHAGPDDWPAVASFCSSQGIGLAMLSMDAVTRAALLSGDDSTLQAMAAFQKSGVLVQALLGEADWIGASPTTLPTAVSEALEIHARHDIFAGLHLDVEPQSLAQWKAGNRATVAVEYLDLLSRIRAASGGVALEATVVPTYLEVTMPDGASLLSHVAGSVDGVALMAYRNTPDAAMRYARSAIQALPSSRCSWRFGVLVDKSDETGISYFGTDAATFQSDMVATDRAIRSGSAAGYEGLVFEDYAGLRAILASTD